VLYAPIIVKQTIADGETEDWEAYCPPGRVVVSGGFGGSGNYGAGLEFTMSQPRYENNGWRFQAKYVRPSVGGPTTEAYGMVTCAEGRSIG
jgi:hypothetical protein